MDQSNRIDTAHTFSTELRKRRQTSAEDGQQDLFAQALGQQLAKNHDDTAQRYAVGKSRSSDRADRTSAANQPARDPHPAPDAVPANAAPRDASSGKRANAATQASAGKGATTGAKSNTGKSSPANASQTGNAAKPDDGTCAADSAPAATPEATDSQAKAVATAAEDAAKTDDAASATPTPATAAIAPTATQPVAQATVLLLSGIPTPQENATTTATGADPVALAALLGKLPATTGPTPKAAANPAQQQNDSNAIGDGTQPEQQIGQAKPADAAPTDRAPSQTGKPKAKAAATQNATARDAADAIVKPVVTQQASLSALTQTTAGGRGISLPEGMGMNEDGEIGASDLEFSAWSEQIGPGLAQGGPRGANWAQSAFLAQLKQNIQTMPPHEQVAVQIQRAAQNGVGRLTVDLQPAELGRVEIKMSVDKDKNVTASVVVDRPATLDLLQRDARNLERILQDAGLQTDSGSLSFSLRNSGGDAQGQNQGGSTGNGNRGGAENGEAAATASAVSRPTVVATADGYVDLET